MSHDEILKTMRQNLDSSVLVPLAEKLQLPARVWNALLRQAFELGRARR